MPVAQETPMLKKRPKHKRPKKPRIISAKSVFIAPLSCGSKVGHIIRRDEWGNYYGNVELHECGRQINWQLNLYSKDGQQTAIAKLRAARAALAEIQSIVERLEFKPTEED